jgi:hypothetical protein
VGDEFGGSYTGHGQHHRIEHLVELADRRLDIAQDHHAAPNLYLGVDPAEHR